MNPIFEKLQLKNHTDTKLTYFFIGTSNNYFTLLLANVKTGLIPRLFHEDFLPVKIDIWATCDTPEVSILSPIAVHEKGDTVLIFGGFSNTLQRSIYPR